MKIFYFGRLSDRVGMRQETLALPTNIETLFALKSWLNDKHDLGGALEETSIKSMINQNLVHGDAPLTGCIEIGFLPPVGGG